MLFNNQDKNNYFNILEATLICLISCGFVLCYSHIKNSSIDFKVMKLPPICTWYTWSAKVAFFFPLIFLFGGIILEKRKIAFNYFITLNRIFAFTWVLLCILAWEIPFILIDFRHSIEF